MKGLFEETMKIYFDEYIIRSWSEEDAPSLSRYANNRKIWANLRDAFPHPYTVEEAEWWINNAREEIPERSFAISNQEGIIGGIGLTFQEDVHRFSAELGYWLAEPYWSQGIMTRAVISMTDYAFDNYPIVRIFAGPFSQNEASRRVLDKAGYHQEGVLKNNVVKDGRIIDQVLYGKTRLRSYDQIPWSNVIV